MGFLRRVLSAAIAEVQRQAVAAERERVRQEALVYSRVLAMTILEHQRRSTGTTPTAPWAQKLN